MKLILDKVSRSFPGRTVFKDISVEIEADCKLVITGHNGSGKTTLLNIISSVLPPTGGRVIFEFESKKYSGAEILPFIGLVSPDLYLYDELTANENLRFFARISGNPQVDFAGGLEKFGLAGRGDDLVKSFSSGMKQRLKYILATHRKPPLLILDEPSANLDNAGKEIVAKVIEQHKGIVVIATNESDELKYADRKIERGR